MDGHCLLQEGAADLLCLPEDSAKLVRLMNDAKRNATVPGHERCLPASDNVEWRGAHDDPICRGGILRPDRSGGPPGHHDPTDGRNRDRQDHAGPQYSRVVATTQPSRSRSSTAAPWRHRSSRAKCSVMFAALSLALIRTVSANSRRRATGRWSSMRSIFLPDAASETPARSRNAFRAAGLEPGAAAAGPNCCDFQRPARSRSRQRAVRADSFIASMSVGFRLPPLRRAHSRYPSPGTTVLAGERACPGPRDHRHRA